MTILTLLFIATLAQDPTPTGVHVELPVPEQQGLRLDQIELHGGEVLEGRIVTEVGSFVEIELAPGAVVGFRLAQVAAIRRGQGAVAAPKEPAMSTRDEWFTLHDGTGAAIGSLHSTVTPCGDRGTRVCEEWEFLKGKQTFQITVFADADPTLRPRSCYFRERILEDTAIVSPLDPMARTLRVRAERIVEARVQEGELLVHSLTVDGPSERRVQFPSGATFPLLARAKPDGSASRTRTGQVLVFDPALDDLRTIDFLAERTRRIAIDGVETAVDEMVEIGTEGSNATWRDASIGIVRREIAGPALVAVRSNREEARATSSVQALPKPFVAEAGGRFGLWLPNPAWRPQQQPIGTVALICDLHSAAITMTLLDHLDRGTPLATAAAAVERWSQLLHPQLTVHSQSLCTVRGAPAVQLDSRGGTGLAEDVARMFVLSSGTGFLVLRCSAPAASWMELEADFVAAAGRLELSPAAVASLDGQTPMSPLHPEVSALRAAAVHLGAVEKAPLEADARKSKKGRVRVPSQIGDGR